MVDCQFFYDSMLKQGIDFFTGVPDSLLKNITACIADQSGAGRHITAANEGGAVALAAGHYLATGRPGLVYMQNSGLGNAINPLVSLTDPMVYNMPLLLLIGWRGEPGLEDEPQHLKQGLVTLPLLQALGLQYSILPGTEEDAYEELVKATEHIRALNEPYALVAGKDIFGPYEAENENASRTSLAGFKGGAAAGEDPGEPAGQAGFRGSFEQCPLTREEAAIIALESLQPGAAVISTTGKLSREIYEYRERSEESHEKDFLNVGSMGHASQIALSVALNLPGREIYCFDGDGAVLMHMGALATSGTSGAANYKHLVFNNGAHESVGGQPTVAGNIDLVKIAKACSYNKSFRAETKEQLDAALEKVKANQGPVFLEIRVRPGGRKELGRPKSTPQENKRQFMQFLQKGSA